MLTENITTICNKALALIGESPINSYKDDESLAGRVCRDWFDLTYHKVLEEGQWPFTTTEEPLQKVNHKDYSEEQKYLYAIPNNCALVLRVYKKYNRKNMMSDTDWDIRYIEDLSTSCIICNYDNKNEENDPNEELIIEYVRVVKNMSVFSAKFFECLIAALALNICMSITKDFSKYNNIFKLYQTLKDESLRNILNQEGQDKMHWVDPITNSRG